MSWIPRHNKDVQLLSRLGGNSYTTLDEFPLVSLGEIVAYSFYLLVKRSLRLKSAKFCFITLRN